MLLEPIPALHATDFSMVEFRDPKTHLGGRVIFHRVGDKLLVEFDSLEPGVMPVRAFESPVMAGAAAQAVRHAIEWLEAVDKMMVPGAMEGARPTTFEGLSILERLAEQLEKEARHGS
jgi:hypothetical protein